MADNPMRAAFNTLDDGRGSVRDAWYRAYHNARLHRRVAQALARRESDKIAEWKAQLRKLDADR